jgi:hypothetical protein
MIDQTNKAGNENLFIDEVLERENARDIIATAEVTPPAKPETPEGVNVTLATYTSTEIKDLPFEAPECLRKRKAYRERAHVLACMGGMEIGSHESTTCIMGEHKVDIAVLRDTRNGLPVGAVVRQDTGEFATMELWSPLFLERTRGRTVGQADLYRKYYHNLKDVEFVKSELVALYGRQTEDEVKYKDTIHHNGRGFCAFSGKAGSKLAEKALTAGSEFTEAEMTKAVTICLRHRRQAITQQ